MIEQPDHSARTEQTASKRSWLEDGIHSTVGFFLGDDRQAKESDKTNLRAEIEHYSAEALKTAPLFLPVVGRAWAVAGFGGAALLQGLDQVHAGDSRERQAADFALGCAKGAMTKGTFEVLGKADFGALNKAVDWGLWPKALGGAPLELTGKAFSFGLSNRLLDTSLTSQTWLDKSGHFDVAKGLNTTVGDMVRPSALLTDVAVFAGSPLLLKGANIALRGALDRSPLAQTIGTGSSFGLLSGSLSEAQRQYNEDAHFDPGKIAMRGFLEAGATGLGATAGGFRANYLAFRSSPIGETRTAMAQSESRQSRVPVSFSDPAGEFAHDNLPDQMAPQRAAIVPAPANATAAELLGIKAVEHIGTHTDASEGALFGAKQYRTEEGLEFWQLTDGRILYERAKGKQYRSPKVHIWAPPASEAQASSGILEPFKAETKIEGAKPKVFELVRHLTLDERHGIHRDIDGAPYHWYRKNNLFDDPKRAPAVDGETIDRLRLVAPNVEKDWQAATRILPTESGNLYETAPIQSWQTVSDLVRLNGKPADRVQEGSQSGRIYRLLSADQAVALADAKEQLAAGQLDQTAYNEELSRLRGAATTVLVPETYAQRLDALRELRSTATLSPAMLPELAEDILRARRDLFVSPYRDRLLPEQMGQFIELPDRSMLSHLYLLDGSADQYKLGNPVADALIHEGRVRMFSGADSATNQIREILTHEWTHLAEKYNPDLKALYTAAKTMEPFVPRSYANKNDSEHWAGNLGEMFLDSDSELFLTLTHFAPIKSVILADVMQRTLQSVPAEQGSADAKVLQARIDYVKQEIEPKARRRLIAATRSSDPTRLVQAADLISAFNSHGALDSGSKLLDRLFDKNGLIATIDKHSDDKSMNAEFDWQQEAGKLVRLEILRQIDPYAFAARQAEYDRTLATTSAFTRAFMLTADHPNHSAVRDFAEALSKSSSLRTLFGELYPTSDLMRAAMNGKDQTAASQAFALITQGSQARQARLAALDIAQSEGPSRLDAAKYLTDENSVIGMRNSFPLLAKLVDQRVPELISPEFAKHLSGKVDADLDETFDSRRVAKLLLRSNLLENIVNRHLSLLDDPMKERFAHVNNVKLLTRDWLEKAMKPSVEFTAGLNRESAIHMLEELSRSTDQDMLAITKELAPRMVLEQALRSGEVEDPRVLAVARRLYGEEMNPLLLQLAAGNGALRDAAVRDAVGSSNLELLKQMKPLIDRYSGWGNEPLRLLLVDDLSRRVGWAVERPDLRGEARARTALQLDMMKELSKPMRMEFYGQALDQLHNLIELAERRLKEAAPS